MMKHKTTLIIFSFLLLFTGYAMGQGEDVSLQVTETLEKETFDAKPNEEVMLTGEGEIEEFSVDKVYVVQSGDTLWDICSLLLDDPYYWPKLWSLNKYIKNPHLIFPGDQLVFTPGTESAFPNLEIIKEDEEQMVFEVVRGEKKANDPEDEIYTPLDDPFGTTVVEKNIATGQGVSIRLANKYILTPKNINTVGKVTHSGEPKMMLGFGDRVYVDFFRSDYKKNVQVGKKYYVIEKIKNVDNPAGSGTIGTLIKKKAVVQITDIRTSPHNKKKRVFEGAVVDAEHATRRGDALIEYRPEIRNLVPHFTDTLIKGHIAEGDKEQMMISNNDFIFLDIGSKDGLKEGLQLYVVRRGDGVGEDGDKHLPDVAVGRVMVVETWETVSTAYVVSLDQALVVGDRLTTVIE